MKGAAKCDEHCELQNSVNQLDLERMLCFRDSPESSSASASAVYFLLRDTQFSHRVFACQDKYMATVSGLQKIC